jgi:replicative DNA helicase
MSHADPKLERAYLASLLAFDPPGDRLPLADYAGTDTCRVAAAIAAVRERGDVPDRWLVEEQLRSDGADVGLVSMLPEGQLDWDYTRRRLAGLAKLRRARAGLLLAISAVDREDLESAAEHALNVADGHLATTRALSEQAAVTARLGVAELVADRASRAVARTGFPTLDAAIGALRPGTMFTIGGRTGAGKSSVLLAIGMHAARVGSRVGIVSCEDARSVWGPRVLAHLCDVNDECYQESPLPQNIERETERGIALAADIGLHFAFALNRPLADVIAAIRALAAAGCGVIGVDYLQAVRLDARGESRHIPTSNAAQAIKAECQALGVSLILASQLRRPADNPFKEPHSSDLKESGDLENMSEAIALMWNTSDSENADAMGKVSKVKWSNKRPRFRVERNPRTGAVVNLARLEQPPPQEPDRRQW